MNRQFTELKDLLVRLQQLANKLDDNWEYDITEPSVGDVLIPLAQCVRWRGASTDEIDELMQRAKNTLNKYNT